MYMSSTKSIERILTKAVKQTKKNSCPKSKSLVISKQHLHSSRLAVALPGNAARALKMAIIAL